MKIILKRPNRFSLEITQDKTNLVFTLTINDSPVQTFILNALDQEQLEQLLARCRFLLDHPPISCAFCRQRPAIDGYMSCEECANNPYDFGQDDFNFDANREKR